MRLDNFSDGLESPIVDGIIYPSGRILLLNVKVKWDYSPRYSISFGGETTIQSLETSGNLYWSGCSVMKRAIHNIGPLKNVEILLGEGSSGGDGFVALIRKPENTLIWLAFFTQSNPFCDVRVEGTKIIATTTIGCEWKFELYSPKDCKVTRGNDSK